MLGIGIIAEYDPFHNGHKYLAEKARELGASHVAAVMSGAAVQRGSVAVYDKYYRAAAAVKNGVDLVLELPCPYSCSSARIFADAAVRLLSSAGKDVIGGICFGSETDDKSDLLAAADASLALEDSQSVRENLACGKSYPAAVAQAAAEEYGEKVYFALSNPNSTLAVEYIKAAHRHAPYLEFFPIRRKAAAHGELTAYDGFASGAAIRQLLREGKDAACCLPQCGEPPSPCFLENMDAAMLYLLSRADKTRLTDLPDVSESMVDVMSREIKAMPQSTEQFLAACKSRSVTLARLRRAVLAQIPIPYGRILAFNEKGAQMLREWGRAIPIDTSLARLEKTSPQAARISRLEQNAARLQYLCGGRNEKFINEYERKITITF